MKLCPKRNQGGKNKITRDVSHGGRGVPNDWRGGRGAWNKKRALLIIGGVNKEGGGVEVQLEWSGTRTFKTRFVRERKGERRTSSKEVKPGKKGGDHNGLLSGGGKGKR